MVSITALWLPILVASVFVFVVSSLLHMVLPLHRGDYRTLPDEAGVMDALHKFNVPPGDYMMPRAGSPEAMRTPEFKAKFQRGPVAIMTFYPPGNMGIGASLAQWFVFLLLVNVFVAYVCGRALAPGAPYLHAFRFAGATTFMCHFLGQVPDSIWYKRNWATTARFGVDGIVYALVTAGTFGWLWPK